MTIMLSFSLRSPIKSYNMHIQLFMDQISITQISTNLSCLWGSISTRNGYHVISLYKITYQVSTLCISNYSWIKSQSHNFGPTYRNYKALNSKRHGYQVISLCEITHQVSTICMSISVLNEIKSHIFWQTYRNL